MKLDYFLAPLAALLIAISLWRLTAADAGMRMTPVRIGTTPARIYRPLKNPVGPVIVIAHGFAGSQQLMQSFAIALARNGYIAVTFDFPGHGRNPQPLTGSITEADGATQSLVDALGRVARYSRTLGDGRLAVLGHSMASDIVIRYAESAPEVAATIVVSMFSPAVTARAPRNLLIIVGAWEGTLKRVALRAVGLAIAPSQPSAGVTYGSPTDGTGRRVAFTPHVDHVSVLFSQVSVREAIAWVDATFGTVRSAPFAIASRGPWILLLVGAVVMLARPLSNALPRIAVPAIGAGLGGARLWSSILIPMVSTPLLLRIVPTHFLPVLVADYLAVHFALYGLITRLCLQRYRPSYAVSAPWRYPPAMAAATLAVIGFGFVGLIVPIDRYFTSFILGPSRFILFLAMLAGTLLYFMNDEWLTRGVGAARGAYLVSKIAFLVSLGIAIALDPVRLFFLVIIVPVILLFFVVYGLFSAWTYRRTGHPYVAGIANAVAFAWAISVTFPLLAD